MEIETIFQKYKNLSQYKPFFQQIKPLNKQLNFNFVEGLRRLQVAALLYF
jgi:hypothetical protein